MSTLIEIKIPDIGDVTDAEIIEIPIAVGDHIDKEDTLIVLETDKASMDVPSPSSGVVKKLLCKIGDKVSQDSLILLLDQVADGVTAAAEPKSEQEPKIEPELQPETTPVAEPISNIEAIELPVQAPPVPDYPALHEATRKGMIYASPAIRRFARELGTDLSSVSGTGAKGRILKEDVQQFVKYELSRPKANGNTCAFNLPKVPKNDFSKFGETEAVPLSRIQKISSVNLHRNWMTIPHVTQHDEADITELEAFRKSMKDEAAAEGIRLTALTFMMKAVVASLKAYPRFNSSLADDGENLILKKYFHIGVAVDTPDGLVVPVIRDVDQKSIYQLANELAEVSAKARDKKLGVDGMQGSCFTISSLGGIGGTAFSPIVNWPDVAILGISKSVIKPVWDGKDFQPRLMLPLSLSYDHRVIDGAVSARFITHLSKTLGDIRRLVL